MLEPSALVAQGYTSALLDTGCPWAPVYGATSPKQVIPRYLVLYKQRHIPNFDILADLSAIPKRKFSNFQKEMPRSGLLDQNDEFVTIWSPTPAFEVHVLVILKQQVPTA
eukprot:TRINITY_DN2072_c0_g2_i2.p3 TRINITY_DN2072_c0_g2~~TRINITY_DN2072_c0_g2_i2.p3  ORF type:complete len:110 (+),score=18.60 TRINITY_DN2072_c0_g2_i2:297-626(+)